MILVTGAAGFIGYHVSKRLLERGEQIIGVDNLNSYYSIELKQYRLAQLAQKKGFEFHECDIGHAEAMKNIAKRYMPQRIVHLAAQAGVRYSIENPQAYVHANLIGHANVLDVALISAAHNTVYASSSSVYGKNSKTPFAEIDKTDDQVSFYGATKKSNELMSNAYARLHGLPMTGLRFFTVYGAAGRPDMAYWLFADKILKGESIQIFNNGKMSRDFTYIDDIVDGIIAALDSPSSNLGLDCPHRIYNLGNDKPEKLMTLVDGIEAALDRKAIREFMPMQMGDVENTWADISRARDELGYEPKITLKDGLVQFTEWFDAWVKR